MPTSPLAPWMIRPIRAATSASKTSCRPRTPSDAQRITAGTSPAQPPLLPLGSAAVEAAHGEVSQQLTTDLAPHHAGKPAPAPQTAPAPAPAGAASTRRRGLMVHQYEPHRGEQPLIMTCCLQ